MPIVDHDGFCEMLDKAHAGQYAYPAINISNIDTLNGAIEGFAEAKSDGIIQVSTGAAQHAYQPRHLHHLAQQQGHDERAEGEEEALAEGHGTGVAEQRWPGIGRIPLPQPGV